MPYHTGTEVVVHRTRKVAELAGRSGAAGGWPDATCPTENGEWEYVGESVRYNQNPIHYTTTTQDGGVRARGVGGSERLAGN